MARRKSDYKIIKFKKVRGMNLGTLIFFIVFIYLVICFVSYFTSTHYTPYEVLEGSLAVSNKYEGIALRDEKIVDAGTAGYVNYFANEGEKVAFNEVVCCIDETGALKDYLIKNEEDNANLLTEKELNNLRNEIIGFSSEFDKNDFFSTYDFKHAIKDSVLKYTNKTKMKSLEQIKDQNSLVKTITSPFSGIVLYSLDGFEDKLPEQISRSWFDKERYEENKNQLINNSIVNPGDPLYKLSDNENWSIIIEVEPERYEEILEEEYIKVMFYKNHFESWAKVDGVIGQDDGKYIMLSFTNSMITFVQDRFIEIQLMLDTEKGLKIPNCAITQKQFYLVPSEYITTSHGSSEVGVMVERRNEAGDVTVEFVETPVYLEKKEYEILGINKNSDAYANNTSEMENTYSYIADDLLASNSIIVKPDSTDRYVIARTGTLTGVYRMNKNYPDFKTITVLSSNDEYSIVKSGTQYGLQPHDYISLYAIE